MEKIKKETGEITFFKGKGLERDWVEKMFLEGFDQAKKDGSVQGVVVFYAHENKENLSISLFQVLPPRESRT